MTVLFLQPEEQSQTEFQHPPPQLNADLLSCQAHQPQNHSPQTGQGRGTLGEDAREASQGDWGWVEKRKPGGGHVSLNPSRTALWTCPVDNGSVNAGFKVRREMETQISKMLLQHSATASTEIR